MLLPFLLLCAGTAQAEGDLQPTLARGRDLFDYGRWSDARHEFLQARAALEPADRAAREEIDY